MMWPMLLLVLQYCDKYRSDVASRHWTEKLLTDVGAKDRTLTDLTAAREADAQKKAEKTARLAESEAFVATETEKRERERLKRERVELEVRTAIRIQSWWRMILVRKCLGPYRKKKQKTSKQEQQQQGGGGAGSKNHGNKK